MEGNMLYYIVKLYLPFKIQFLINQKTQLVGSNFKCLRLFEDYQ